MMRMENNLREIRKSHKISLEKLAEAAGTSQQQLGRLEKGERRLSDHWIERIVNAYHSLGYSQINSMQLIANLEDLQQTPIKDATAGLRKRDQALIDRLTKFLQNNPSARDIELIEKIIGDEK